MSKRVSKTANSRQSRREKWKNARPQRGNPAFPCSVGNDKKVFYFDYVNVRHLWPACCATTTISQHQHGNRSGFHGGGNILDRANTCKICSQHRNGGGPKNKCKAVCSRQLDRIENGRGGGRKHERFRRDCCWLGVLNCGWARENGRGSPQITAPHSAQRPLLGGLLVSKCE